MDKEKMDVRELTEKELEMVSGGGRNNNCMITCSYINNPSACPTYSSCPRFASITEYGKQE